MATWTIAPSFAAQLDEKPRVLRARFGDGYEQRVGDGINLRPRVWSLRFAARTPTERDAVLAALRAENGITAFDWTDPLGFTGKWICEEWSTALENAASNTVTAVFRQVFDF